MRGIPKILYVTDPSNGCGHYRAAVVARALRRKGLAEARVPERRDTEFEQDFRTADFIVHHTASSGHLYSYVRLMKRMKQQCQVCDLDDNPWEVSPFNDAYVRWGTSERVGLGPDGRKQMIWQAGIDGFNPEDNEKELRRRVNMLRHAKLLTTTTPYLAQLFKEKIQKNVVALPNCIDFHHWQPWPLAKNPDEIRVGWYGGASHFEDVTFVFQNPDATHQSHILEWLMATYPQVKLVIYGTWFPFPFRDLPQERVEFHPWVHVDAHALKLASLNLDIGLVPLRDTEFNRCKSELKWTEMSALGVPCVISNLRPYSPVVKHGETGLLVDGAGEWKAALSALVDDATLRQKIGQRAREYVREHYDIDRECVRWLEAYLEADRDYRWPAQVDSLTSGPTDVADKEGKTCQLAL